MRGEASHAGTKRNETQAGTRATHLLADAATLHVPFNLKNIHIVDSGLAWDTFHNPPLALAAVLATSNLKKHVIDRHGQRILLAFIDGRGD